MVCCATQLMAQIAPIDFEPSGHGATWGFSSFENLGNLPLAIIPNPSPSGINNSSTVAAYTALQGGQPWAGFETIHGSGIGTFTLTAENAIVKIKVWKSVISDVGIKFAVNDGGSTGEIKVANTLINQWEELVFDFSSKIGEPTSTDIDQIIIFPDFNFARSSDNTVYIDDITFSPADPGDDPMVAAPAPTLPQSDVISLFSNSYTNIAVDTWQTNWSDAVLTDVQIAGNDTKKYDPLVFVGIETVATPIDITAMTFFNLDVWSPDFTVFKVKLVDFGANGIFGGGDDVEHEVTFNNLTQSAWNSLHIPMAEFENLVTREHIAQLILVGAGAKVYVDNVYFSNEPFVEVPTDPEIAAPSPTLPASQVISMFSNAYTNVPVDTWKTSWSDATLADVQIQGNDTKKYTGLNFVGIESIASQMDITSMTHFNVDVWSPNFTVFKVKLVDFGANAAFGGGDDVEHELTFNNPTQSQWITYSLPLADFVNLTTRQHIAQLIFVGGGAKVYVDNVYFSNADLNTDDHSLAKLSMYPNPATDRVHLDSTWLQGHIMVSDMLGKTVINKQITDTSLDVSILKPGIYIVSTTKDGVSDSGKLVIR